MNLTRISDFETRNGDDQFAGVVADRAGTNEEIYEQEESTANSYPGIVGRSAALREVLQQVEMVAPTDSTVLLLGETGTGKELIARAIHDRSSRKNRTLVTLNCAAIPGGLPATSRWRCSRNSFACCKSEKLSGWAVR